jgi:tetratricopeptide (TPR) repeat protein
MPVWFVLLTTLLFAPIAQDSACTTPSTPANTIEACTAAIEADPDDPTLYLYRGYAYLELEEWSNAIKDYNDLLLLDDSNEQAYNNRGFAWQQLENMENALADYTAALELEPDYVDALINRGSIYSALEQYEDALADFDRALELDPENVNGLNNRAHASNFAGDPLTALADYTQVIELDPENGYAYNARGQILLTLGDCRRAISSYDRAIEYDGDEQIESYYGRAFCNAELGNYEEALQDYDAALAIDDQRAEILFHRADTFFALEEYETALAEFQRIIDMNTGYTASAYMNIARIAERTDQPELALEAATEYVAIFDQFDLFIDAELPASERDTFDVSFERQYRIAYVQEVPATLIVSAYTERGDVDPVIIIVDPRGDAVAFSDNSYELESGAARVYYGARLPDEYIIIVSFTGKGEGGDIRLVVGPEYE